MIQFIMLANNVWLRGSNDEITVTTATKTDYDDNKGTERRR